MEYFSVWKCLVFSPPTLKSISKSKAVVHAFTLLGSIRYVGTFYLVVKQISLVCRMVIDQALFNESAYWNWSLVLYSAKSKATTQLSRTTSGFDLARYFPNSSYISSVAIDPRASAASCLTWNNKVWWLCKQCVLTAIISHMSPFSGEDLQLMALSVFMDLFRPKFEALFYIK